MKRLFILLGLITTNTIFAQGLEFETYRTEESPGFFMVKIFPGPTTPQMTVQNIFVKNFKNPDDEKDYLELFSIIREFGGKIIDAPEDNRIMLRSGTRLIFLGKPNGKYLNFAAKDSDKVLEEFELFSERYLGPVFLENLTVKFGGNISDVYPQKVKFLSESGATFVGKFETPIKTRMEMKGISDFGEITATAPINLKEIELGQIVGNLADIWEDFWKMENPSATKEWNLKWLMIFPWILGIFGIVIIYFSFRSKKSKTSKKDAKKKTSYSIPEQIPAKDLGYLEELPFEVEKQEK